MPWHWGLGFVGPTSIRSFFGVGGDENPGFSGFPASKAQIVEAAREALQEAEADMADVGWLSGNLPDGTYRVVGEVFTALMPVVASRGQDATALVTALPMTAVASGTRMVVGADQSAVLVGSDGRPLDSFGPGEHLLSREGAPQSAAESRPLAPGFTKSTIDATPVFASTREIRTALNRSTRTRSGQSVALRGSVTVSIGSLPEFLAKVGSRPRGMSAAEGEAEIAKILGAALEQTVASHELGELTDSDTLLEASARSGAAQSRPPHPGTLLRTGGRYFGGGSAHRGSGDAAPSALKYAPRDASEDLGADGTGDATSARHPGVWYGRAPCWAAHGPAGDEPGRSRCVGVSLLPRTEPPSEQILPELWSTLASEADVP